MVHSAACDVLVCVGELVWPGEGTGNFYCCQLEQVILMVRW